jgi:alpha-beta hydrolase superfamily lysophospholipase
VSRRGRFVALIAAVLLAGAAAGVADSSRIALYLMEAGALTTGPNGPETPARVGVAYQRRWIASGPRRLDSYVVAAPASCTDPPVVLIYLGVHETISKWVSAQKFLHDHCVSSVAFDYTGSGDSSRPARFDAVNDDSVAAYEAVQNFFPGARIFVLSHSMGAGPMLEALPRFSTPPAGVIVDGAFSSLRDYGARAGGLYALLADLSPDWWNNRRAIARVRAPILIIHSDADQVIPVGDALRLFAAAREPKRLVIIHGYKHNAIYRAPVAGDWDPVLAFMARPFAPTSRRPAPSAASAYPLSVCGPVRRRCP